MLAKSVFQGYQNGFELFMDWNLNGEWLVAIVALST